MPLYKINVQGRNDLNPAYLGYQFFSYNTLEDFQLTYGFAYAREGFELLPTIPTGCDIAMFSNEPPLEERRYGDVVSPDRPNAVIVGNNNIPLGDTEGEVRYYIKLTKKVNKNEEIVWDYGPDYRRNYRDYWGNRFKRGENVEAYYIGEPPGWYTAKILKKEGGGYLVKWDVDKSTSWVATENIEKI